MIKRGNRETEGSTVYADTKTEISVTQLELSNFNITPNVILLLFGVLYLF
jgi:hypothetical protein